MKALARKLIRSSMPAYEAYAPLIFRNRLKRIFGPKPNHKYLFILCPPFCGSTLLNQLISTSEAVSSSNVMGYREGQNLPTTRALMFADNRWDENLEYDWNYIKKEWHKYWDLTKPVLLEKSPPNLLRATAIAKHFKPAHFIVFFRNPYAHCESLMRRNDRGPESAAIFAVKCLAFQRKNLEQLEKPIKLSYEYLTEKPESAISDIVDQLPELSDIDVNKEFDAHNYLGRTMAIRNLNSEKIGKLSKDDISRINKVFSKHRELLDFFNYSMIEA